jgi:hypothetical protein
MDEHDYFETTDPNIGTWLITNKIAFRGVAPLPDGYTIFRFKPDERITALIDDFNNGAQCSAKDFCANYRFLNGQIKQLRRRNGGTK